MRGKKTTQATYSGRVMKGSKYWRVVLEKKMPDGKRIRLSETTGIRCYPDKRDPDTGKVVKADMRGKGAAEDYLSRWREEKLREEAAEAAEADGSMTVCSYAERLIEQKELGGTVASTTTSGYRTYLKHLQGTDLGETPIAKAEPGQVRKWESGLLEDGLSPTSVSHMHAFLKMVFMTAVRNGDSSRNPMAFIEAPKRRRKPINALDPTGVERLNSILGDDVSPLYLSARLALMTGMREAEICALRWQDVDGSSRTIHVTHALSREHGRYVLSSPKTASSFRTIPYGEALAGALEARRSRMREERAAFGLGWDEGLYVVGSAVTGEWLSPMVLGKDWRALAKATRLVGTQGERVRFHDLRHTFATMAIGSGLDVKTTSSLLGHSSAAMTLDIYADALADSKRSGMERMDAILSASAG